jgi:hypothetical protein
MADGSRRFPPPWHADKIPGGYVVRGANAQAIAYLYSREKEAEPWRLCLRDGQSAPATCTCLMRICRAGPRGGSCSRTSSGTATAADRIRSRKAIAK